MDDFSSGLPGADALAVPCGAARRSAYSPSGALDTAATQPTAPGAPRAASARGRGGGGQRATPGGSPSTLAQMANLGALSNVLDDVKYNNGLQDAEAPDPKRKFGTVTDAERGAQLATLETSGAFGVPTICAGPLGLYEFTRFLGGRDDSARARESVARVRPLPRVAGDSDGRGFIKEAHRGRLPDRNVSVDRLDRLPAPHLKRTPLPDELKPDSPTATKRLKTTSASLKGTQWPFTSTKCR